VKSAPELWELADDIGRMEAWMAGLVGAQDRVSVEVTGREPQRRLEFAAAGGAGTRIAIELAERGLGTAVSITARNAHPAAGATLERVLDELAAPERRPFTR